MSNYAIAGRGDAPADVITAGLTDLGPDSHFYVPWVGGSGTRPTPGMMKVYDFLVDNGATFTLIAKDRKAVHPAVSAASADIRESGTDSPELHFSPIPPDATALILWDDESPEYNEHLVCEYFDRGHALLDLSNGLVPIEVESPATDGTRPVPVEPLDGDNIEPLTDEDMDSLSPAIRKQLDRSMGEVTEDIDEMDDDEVVDNVLQFVRREKETDETLTATLVVVLPTGKAFTSAVPILEVWDLLKATVWSD